MLKVRILLFSKKAIRTCSRQTNYQIHIYENIFYQIKNDEGIYFQYDNNTRAKKMSQLQRLRKKTYKHENVFVTQNVILVSVKYLLTHYFRPLKN